MSVMQQCAHAGSSAFFLTDCVWTVNWCPKLLRLVSGFTVLTPWDFEFLDIDVKGSRDDKKRRNHQLTFVCQADRSCPAGQIYRSCTQGDDDSLHLGRGVACERTCESYLLNLTCSTHEPCVVGCTCPPGWAYLKRHCMVSLSVCRRNQSTDLVFCLGLSNKSFFFNWDYAMNFRLSSVNNVLEGWGCESRQSVSAISLHMRRRCG